MITSKARIQIATLKIQRLLASKSQEEALVILKKWATLKQHTADHSAYYQGSQREEKQSIAAIYWQAVEQLEKDLWIESEKRKGTVFCDCGNSLYFEHEGNLCCTNCYAIHKQVKKTIEQAQANCATFHQQVASQNLVSMISEYVKLGRYQITLVEKGSIGYYSLLAALRVYLTSYAMIKREARHNAKGDCMLRSLARRELHCLEFADRLIERAASPRIKGTPQEKISIDNASRYRTKAERFSKQYSMLIDSGYYREL